MSPTPLAKLPLQNASQLSTALHSSPLPPLPTTRAHLKSTPPPHPPPPPDSSTHPTSPSNRDYSIPGDSTSPPSPPPPAATVNDKQPSSQHHQETATMPSPIPGDCASLPPAPPPHASPRPPRTSTITPIPLNLATLLPTAVALASASTMSLNQPLDRLPPPHHPQQPPRVPALRRHPLPPARFPPPPAPPFLDQGHPCLRSLMEDPNTVLACDLGWMWHSDLGFDQVPGVYQVAGVWGGTRSPRGRGGGG